MQPILCKDSANERNESLLSNCRVQPILCKDSEFPRDRHYFSTKNARRPEIIVCCVQIEFSRKPASIHHWLFSQLTVSEPNLSDSMTSPALSPREAKCVASKRREIKNNGPIAYLIYNNTRRSALYLYDQASLHIIIVLPPDSTRRIDLLRCRKEHEEGREVSCPG